MGGGGGGGERRDLTPENLCDEINIKKKTKKKTNKQQKSKKQTNKETTTTKTNEPKSTAISNITSCNICCLAFGEKQQFTDFLLFHNIVILNIVTI